MEQTDITQRLRKLANRLLDAYEAIDPPTTFTEADRAAKALISIGKAIKLAGEEQPAPLPRYRRLFSPASQRDRRPIWRSNVRPGRLRRRTKRAGAAS